jgi:hypothetical protein
MTSDWGKGRAMKRKKVLVDYRARAKESAIRIISIGQRSPRKK